MTKVAIAFLAWIICSLAQAADLSGVPRVVDGDTLAIGTTKIRLEGIDAPETDQICLNANGMHWTCGIDARDELAAHIGGRAISCSPKGSDAYKRTLVICSLAGEDLNAWMVRQGWALAYVQYSSAYRKVEDDAAWQKAVSASALSSGDAACRSFCVRPLAPVHFVSRCNFTRYD
jgi:endonuclease YncB( thermonuclease family)